MAKNRRIYQIAPAGKATPAAPPVGPALGQHSVNIVKKQFNARTADRAI